MRLFRFDIFFISTLLKCGESVVGCRAVFFRRSSLLKCGESVAVESAVGWRAVFFSRRSLAENVSSGLLLLLRSWPSSLLKCGESVAVESAVESAVGWRALQPEKSG